MENNIYTVDFFINKFSVIPEDGFIVGAQSDGNGRHCAIGWCRRESENILDSTNIDNSLEVKSLSLLFESHNIKSVTMPSYTKYGWNIADVNNGYNPLYQQPTPKQRILAALANIKALQAPEPVKERIVYVVVDAKVRELQKLESLC